MHGVKHINFVSICSHVLSVAHVELQTIGAKPCQPSPSSQEGGANEKWWTHCLGFYSSCFLSSGASTIGSLSSEPEEIFTTDDFRSVGTNEFKTEPGLLWRPKRGAFVLSCLRKALVSVRGSNA